MQMVPVEGTEKTVPAQLVLIAAGFLGSENYVTEGFGVETDGRTNVKTAPGIQYLEGENLCGRRYAPGPVPGGLGDRGRTRRSQSGG